MYYKNVFITTIIIVSMLSIGFTLQNHNDNRLTEIAKDYKKYKLFLNTESSITDSARWSWTIQLCTQMKPSGKNKHTFHAGMDSFYLSKVVSGQSPHGDKLYKLYVKDLTAYLDTAIKVQPNGQVIVKETWNVKEVELIPNSNTAIIKNRNNGKWYKPTSISQLFIMYKEKESQNNDQGWVYGIVNIEDGKKAPVIIERGKLSNCISCHLQTKYDRIFGVNK